MATTDGGVPDPAAAAIWGLVRSAQSEHPGRFALIDTDGSEASSEALHAALAIGRRGAPARPARGQRAGARGSPAPRRARRGGGGSPRSTPSAPS